MTRDQIVSRAFAGTLPHAWPGEAHEEAVRRLGEQPWRRSGLRLAPGEVVTGPSDLYPYRVITRIGAVTGRGYPHAQAVYGADHGVGALIVPAEYAHLFTEAQS